MCVGDRQVRLSAVNPAPRADMSLGPYRAYMNPHVG